MKLSAKSRYAARILLELAQHTEASPLTATALAQRTGVSIQFIEQILRLLRQGRLTNSIRGVTGGHMLARPAETVSLGDIVRLTEGGIHLTMCSAKEHSSCSRRGTCLTHPAWARLSRVLEEEMNAISLTDLMKGQKDAFLGDSAGAAEKQPELPASVCPSQCGTPHTCPLAGPE